MSDHEDTGERFMRFHDLYREVIKSEFDALEFAEDDLYAFQVLDRAFRSDDQELRNLAAHLQTQREAALETITLRAGEILENTRRMKTLELKVLEQRGQSGDLTQSLGSAGPAAPADDAPDTIPGPAPEDQPAPDTGSTRKGRRRGWFR